MRPGGLSLSNQAVGASGATEVQHAWGLYTKRGGSYATIGRKIHPAMYFSRQYLADQAVSIYRSAATVIMETLLK